MKQLQTLFAVKRLRMNAELFEIHHNICFDTLQPELCGAQVVSLDTKRQIFPLGDTVVSLSELTPQHSVVLGARGVVTVSG